MGTESPAVWNSKDNPAAVVTTERTTFFGWRWGTDTASAAELDNAWLKASINHYLTALAPSNRIKKIAGGSPNCSTTVAAAPRGQGAGEQGSRGAEVQRSIISLIPPPKTTTAPIPRALPIVKPPSSQEAIDQLEQAVRLDVAPNSNEPIDNNQAIALQQELENLIGRVESAHLAVSADAVKEGVGISERKQSSRHLETYNPQSVKEQPIQLASTKLGGLATSKDQALAQVKVNCQKLTPIDCSKKLCSGSSAVAGSKDNFVAAVPS